MRLILGSQSPRRAEILSFFSYPFEQISSHFAEELVPFNGDPAAYAKTLSRGKAASLAPRYPDATILTADTIVYKDGNLMGKPADEEEAFSMLKTLNGAWHTVYTAITVQRGEKETTECAETRILFHEVSDDALKNYHRAFNGSDKAGGYGIQEGGSVIVKRIEGCFYNVMGLPLSLATELLKERGIDLWHYLDALS